MIPRLLLKTVHKYLAANRKIILIHGARQVGKTTLLNYLRDEFHQRGQSLLYLNCDKEEERTIIDTTLGVKLHALATNIDVLFIDEAQRLTNPGLTLKILYDTYPRLRIIATGSSSFDIKNKVSDALTGRYIDFTLYPFSVNEILPSIQASDNKELRKSQTDALLPDMLLYGLYPGIYLTKTVRRKELFLQKIVESYLFRDVLSFQRVRRPRLIMDLTRALAYQIGSEVNDHELANRLSIDRKTVINYLDILEQSYILIRVFPYAKNLRRSIGRNYKVYFLDTGIRNALIGDFNPLVIRPDAGALWENFLIMERLKTFANQGTFREAYFWRSYSGAEVDYIEKKGNLFSAYEFKYGKGGLSRGTNSFTHLYNVPVKLVNPANYLSFIEYRA